MMVSMARMNSSHQSPGWLSMYSLSPASTRLRVSSEVLASRSNLNSSVLLSARLMFWMVQLASWELDMYVICPFHWRNTVNKMLISVTNMLRVSRPVLTHTRSPTSYGCVLKRNTIPSKMFLVRFPKINVAARKNELRGSRNTTTSTPNRTRMPMITKNSAITVRIPSTWPIMLRVSRSDAERASRLAKISLTTRWNRAAVITVRRVGLSVLTRTAGPGALMGKEAATSANNSKAFSAWSSDSKKPAMSWNSITSRCPRVMFLNSRLPIFLACFSLSTWLKPAESRMEGSSFRRKNLSREDNVLKDATWRPPGDVSPDMEYKSALVLRMKPVHLQTRPQNPSTCFFL
mmetsp:Transcript_36276/g.82680  ORF Transcript_36276/g.82680 Transcript_36276/m.82680 type:complete len:347 (+) Transcript_36276:501-1541(+)